MGRVAGHGWVTGHRCGSQVLARESEKKKKKTLESLPTREGACLIG